MLLAAAREAVESRERRRAQGLLDAATAAVHAGSGDAAARVSRVPVRSLDGEGRAKLAELERVIAGRALEATRVASRASHPRNDRTPCLEVAPGSSSSDLTTRATLQLLLGESGDAAGLWRRRLCYLSPPRMRFMLPLLCGMCLLYSSARDRKFLIA
jgi:hypothetical protein